MLESPLFDAYFEELGNALQAEKVILNNTSYTRKHPLFIIAQKEYAQEEMICVCLKADLYPLVHWLEPTCQWVDIQPQLRAIIQNSLKIPDRQILGVKYTFSLVVSSTYNLNLTLFESFFNRLLPIIHQMTTYQSRTTM